MTKNTESGWKVLATAIICQAVKDKQKAKAALRNNPTHIESQDLSNDVDRFVKSDWFKTLCALSDSDCESLKKKIKEIN